MNNETPFENATSALGACIHYWSVQLDTHIKFIQKTRNLRPVFCTRAGKRIIDFLRIIYGDQAAYSYDLFGISRISACKIALGGNTAISPAIDLCNSILGHKGLSETLHALLVHKLTNDPELIEFIDSLHGGFTEENFLSLKNSNNAQAIKITQYLQNCHDTALDTLLENGPNGALLIDSGWRGSIMDLLQQTFPSVEVEGILFGIMQAPPLSRKHSIVFDAEFYDPDAPETSFAIHRHLIESLFEPNAPTVEELENGPLHSIAQEQLNKIKNESLGASDKLYVAICEYLEDHKTDSFRMVVDAFDESLPKIASWLSTPTKEFAEILSGQPRSIDFGRKGEVPVLNFNEAGNAHGRNDRINAALWPQGQIALEENSEQTRIALQKQVTKVTGTQAYFSKQLKSKTEDRNKAGLKNFEPGFVSVVTRTKNRPLLFERAARSVCSQDYAKINWVIVNDGGDPGPVEQIIDRSGFDLARVFLISNAESVGMEAASNLGVRATGSEFVVIHDDDDSWEPNYLTAVTSFLNDDENEHYSGVITRTNYVSEEIRYNDIIFHDKFLYHPWVSDVQFAQMAMGNFFAPICFTFRRDVFEEIGGYREELPVLGDWRFNLDFLAKANIGFMDQTLANYHHRDKGDTSKMGVYANSVVGARNLHHKYFSVVVNDFIRDYAENPGIAAMMAQAHYARIMEMRMNGSDDLIRGVGHKIDEIKGSNAQDRIRQLEEENNALKMSLAAMAKNFPSG
ncbi:MAG: glycosyltransferase family 2 protein [Mangrovicoccus sp.]